MDSSALIEADVTEEPVIVGQSMWPGVRAAVFGSTREQTIWRALGICSCLVLLVSLVAILEAAYLISSPEVEVSTPMFHSTEYQAVIFPDDWNTSEKREAMLRDYLDILNAQMGTSLTPSDGGINLRSQFYYTMNGGHRCGSSYSLRVREYLEGPGAGTRYMDLKAGSHIERFACSNPIWPTQESALGLIDADASILKCERDVHACDGKYSMSSRVFFDDSLESMPMLSTCSDVRLFYPWAMDGTTEKQRFNPVTEEMKVHFWWVWSYEGHVDASGPSRSDNASKISIDVTLEYDSLEEAKSGDIEPGHSSEFSMKLYQRDGVGYDSAVQENASAMHRSILDTYGSRGQFEEGVCL